MDNPTTSLINEKRFTFESDGPASYKIHATDSGPIFINALTGEIDKQKRKTVEAEKQPASFNGTTLFINGKTDYYKEGGLETIDILKAKLTTEQFEGFCIGNVYKYLTRAGKKPDNTKKSDFEKAWYYLGQLL